MNTAEKNIVHLLHFSNQLSDVESALLLVLSFFFPSRDFCLHKLCSIPCCSEWSCSIFLIIFFSKLCFNYLLRARYFPASFRVMWVFPWKHFLFFMKWNGCQIFERKKKCRCAISSLQNLRRLSDHLKIKKKYHENSPVKRRYQLRTGHAKAKKWVKWIISAQRSRQSISIIASSAEERRIN